MGLSHATIALTIQYGEYKFGDGELPKDKIRRWSGECMVDTGAVPATINGELIQQPGLKQWQLLNVAMVGGYTHTIEMLGGIKVRFGNRRCCTESFVLPCNTEPLLGAIPLESRDLVVIPSENRLKYNSAHPEDVLFSLK